MDSARQPSSAGNQGKCVVAGSRCADEDIYIVYSTMIATAAASFFIDY